MYSIPFFNFLIFVFGLSVGSFLNCIIYRLENNKSFLRGRSYCPRCKHNLCWQDLIPILSFLILKGKCRYCQKPISFQYPLVELGTAILFLIIFFYFSFNFLLSAFYFLIASFLIIIFVYDLKHYIIPDKVIYPAIVITFFYNILYSLFIIHNSKPLIQSLFSALGAASFFLIIVLISRGRWMGIGDIKLAFFMGLFLSFPGILISLFSAFFIGAVSGLWLIIFGKKTMKSEVPFGPFLITGTFIALFFDQSLINWYWSLFLI